MAVTRKAIQATGTLFLEKYYAGLSEEELFFLQLDTYLQSTAFRVDPKTHAVGGVSAVRPITYEVENAGSNIGLPVGNGGFAYGRYLDSEAQIILEKALSYMAQNVETGKIKNGSYHYERPLAVALSAGMSSLSVALLLLQNIAGQRDISIIVAPDDLYGGTRSLIKLLGINVTYAADSTKAALEAAYKEQGGKTTAIVFETLTNPFTHVADIDGIIQFAKDHNIITIADSTLAPHTRPIARGADIDTISLTKYVLGNEHILGAIVFNANRTDLLERFITLRNAIGPLPGEKEIHAAFMAIGDLVGHYKTHSDNTTALAKWLLDQPQVAKVYYPGVGENPQDELTQKYLGQYRGGLMTIELKGGFAAAEAFSRATQIPLRGYPTNAPLITVADSFGLPITVVNYMRNQMSRYRGMNPEECAAVGITDATFRIGVGRQPVGVIIAAFAQALSAIPKHLYQPLKSTAAVSSL